MKNVLGSWIRIQYEYIYFKKSPGNSKCMYSHADGTIRDWTFRGIDRGLKFSIEPFSVHQECPVNRNTGIEIFDRDCNFRSRLKVSRQDWNIRSDLIFSIAGPSGNCTDAQRFKIARFESQPQIPFDSLWCLYYFFKCLGFFKSRKGLNRYSLTGINCPEYFFRLFFWEQIIADPENLSRN